MRFNSWSWLGLLSNMFTLAVTLAVLILMAALGRRQRGNRSFALFVLLVFGWIGSGQFTQVLIWLGQDDPTLSLRITAAFFFFQAVALYHFAGRLIELRSPWFYLSVGTGSAIGLIGLIPLAKHRILANPSLSPTGLLRWDTFPLGYALFAVAFAYLVAAPVLLLAHHRQVPHPLISLGTSVVAVAEIAGLSASFFALPLPLFALGVSVGVTILGVSMVHYQLLKPIEAMTRELQARQADLEERNRRLEEANIKLHDLDEWREKMTQMVIHDLKSPLNVISVVLNEFRDNLSDYMEVTQHQLLQSGLISAHRIQSLVSSSLDVHRLEDDHLPIECVPFDLISVIDDCLQAVHPLLTVYEIGVNFDRSPGIPEAYADPTLITRVIDNLLDNAIKFSPSPGTVSIRVCAAENKMQTSISDTGPGISPEYQQRIFEKFFQITPASKGARAGVGLGLTFCKLALEAQGGDIWVESDGQSGATFHFTLPIWKQPSSEAEAPRDTVSRTHE